MEARNHVDRPNGTGDVLLMLFHDPCRVDGAAHNPWTLRVWPDGAGHRYGPGPGFDRPWHHSWVHCRGPLADRLAEALPQARSLGDPEPMQRHLRQLTESCLLDHDGILARCAVQGILRCIERLDTAAALPADWRDLRAWMDQNAHRALAIDHLANRVGLRRSRFLERFVVYFGRPPQQYLQDLRLERARWLLRDHRRHVAEVGAEVGYADAAYFSRLMRRKFGVAPRDLRRSAQ